MLRDVDWWLIQNACFTISLFLFPPSLWPSNYFFKNTFYSFLLSAAIIYLSQVGAAAMRAGLLPLAVLHVLLASSCVKACADGIDNVIRTTDTGRGLFELSIVC